MNEKRFLDLAFFWGMNDWRTKRVNFELVPWGMNKECDDKSALRHVLRHATWNMRTWVITASNAARTRARNWRHGQYAQDWQQGQRGHDGQDGQEGQHGQDSTDMTDKADSTDRTDSTDMTDMTDSTDRADRTDMADSMDRTDGFTSTTRILPERWSRIERHGRKRKNYVFYFSYLHWTKRKA